MQAHDFTASGLQLGYDDAPIIEGLDLVIPEGRITVIVGANASGKSTLLRGLARLLKPRGGVVTLDGHDIHSIPTKRLAAFVGLLPQHPIAPDGITVADLVARGRYPHQGIFRQRSAEDDAIVERSLVATSTLELAGRRIEDLSGGQRQRVWVAMALAQEPDILLLDEPTTFLDVTHQLEVLDLLHDLNETRGTTIVMVLHDLNLAARYAHNLVVMAGGRIITEGAPRDVVTVETVQEAFGLGCLVIDDPVCATPMVIPFGAVHKPR
jgi:iron complex transport system ATP-binding protein